MGALTRIALAALATVGALGAPLAADAAVGARIDVDSALEQSEAAIGNRVGDYVLTNSQGEPLPLSSYRGRPLVISLVYTSCSSVCPLTTQHVLQAVRRARAVLGDDAFSVLTLGFDARHDTPAQLAAFADRQGIDLADWRLASADAATMTAILDKLGFSYDAAAGGYQHLTQTTILDAEGRVYRQVYGDAFPDQVFIEPLKELVFGTETRSLSLTGLADRIRFVCTIYNPSTGAYEFDYGILFGIVIGGFSLILTGLVVVRLWLANRRVEATRRREKQGPA